ncbi:MAG: Tyrosine recombinase XerD [Candidatus Peribacteria bacterium GW2011_GWB1_54_5]|nr:MAG: Tyrosine recombinase XerD [Candidatus Peribacteria bacterium GW2011_GWB1_54_5]
MHYVKYRKDVENSSFLSPLPNFLFIQLFRKYVTLSTVEVRHIFCPPLSSFVRAQDDRNPLSHQSPSMENALSQAMDRYIVYLQAEENKSPLTVANYRRSLNLLLDLLGVSDAKNIDKTVIRTLKSKLHGAKARSGKPLSITTKNYHLTVLRAFLRYLLQDEEMDGIYAPDRIQRFKQEERQVKVLRREELSRLLESPDVSTRTGKRDKAIMELFFSTGLRLAELRSLNVRDLNFDTREISVRGKRGKIRVVFLSDRAVDSLRAYLEARTDDLTPLFIRNMEKAQETMPPGEEFRLSRISIYNVVKKYALIAGVVSDPSPHTLRHSFATDLLRNGADLRSVQELLGHADLSTTQIYTHVTNPQLKEVHEKYHGK